MVDRKLLTREELLDTIKAQDDEIKTRATYIGILKILLGDLMLQIPTACLCINHGQGGGDECDTCSVRSAYEKIKEFLKPVKKIVVVMDDQTCSLCSPLDGQSPERVGYPPFHEPDKETGRICRCVVVDEYK